MLTGVSSCSGMTEMSLERYTRLLMDTSSEFPIHFLKIYRHSWGGDKSASRCQFHGGAGWSQAWGQAAQEGVAWDVRSRAHTGHSGVFASDLQTVWALWSACVVAWPARVLGGELERSSRARPSGAQDTTTPGSPAAVDRKAGLASWCCPLTQVVKGTILPDFQAAELSAG
jgi:hypothetical protein